MPVLPVLPVVPVALAEPLVSSVVDAVAVPSLVPSPVLDDEDVPSLEAPVDVLPSPPVQPTPRPRVRRIEARMVE
jgi:hypothetical protein